MSKRKKRNIIIGSLCAVVLLMAVGYAAFQSALNIEGTSNITSSWNIKITGITSKNIVGTASNNGEPTFEDLTATFKTNLVSPGDSIEYDIVVKNAGTLNAKLDKITLSDTNNPAIKFTSSGLTEGDVLNAGSTTTLTVKVEFLSSVTEVPESKTSTLTVALDYSQSTSEGSGGIAAADMLKENVVTTGDGLYEDTTEAGRYVYRGASPSNNVTFNNEVYRIVSIEADNTIKIIREEKLDTNMALDTANSRTAAYCTHPQHGCNVWGSKTTMLDANGQNVTQMAYNLSTPTSKYELPTKEATLNTYLNGEYYNNLAEESKGQVTTYAFNTGVLLHTGGQTLETDLSQVQANKWNGNIGLIEATDYVKASTDSSCTNVYSGTSNNSSYPCKNGNYLYKSGYDWLTISLYSSSNSYYVRIVEARGFLTVSYATSTFGVRPVVHLKSDIKLSGEGTTASPYTIES